MVKSCKYYFFRKSIVIVVVLMLITATGHAQFFVEGGGSIGYSESNTFDVLGSKIFTFKVSQKIGYLFNDNIAAGAMITYTYRSYKDIEFNQDDPNLDKEGIYREPEWRISVFGRYKLLSKEKFSVLVESSIGFGRSTLILKDFFYDEIGHENIKFFDVVPSVSYELSEKFSIFATCDILKLGFTYTSGTNVYNEGKKATACAFGFRTESPTFFRMSFLYKF